MVRIAPVNLTYNPKTLWFDAQDHELEPGQPVVVSTARGTEFGRLDAAVFEATDEQMKSLKSPLKPVLRAATEEDEAQAARMIELSQEAMPVFREMAAEFASDMRPVSVEYLLDGDKAIFYFESEDRVDFRDLVRKLAGRFHVRVDMRQIGVRDEARLVGGLGHCGQELCCKRLGGEFCPVSIRMAKEQDLSLNPQKISGLCGRLMCCLRYEFEAYKDFKGRCPKAGSTVQTPDGPAKVVDLDVPREVVSVRVEGEKPVKVPLADFDPPEEGNRPKVIGEQAWEQAQNQGLYGTDAGMAAFATVTLSGSDKLAERGSVRRVERTKRSEEQRRDGSAASGRDKGQGRKGSKRSGSDGQRDGSGRSGSRRRPRNGASPGAEQASGKGRRQQGKGGQDARGQGGGRGPEQARKQQGKGSGPRPGQKSSGLRAGRDRSQGAAQASAAGAPDQHRRARRRTHKANSDAGAQE
ncbi:regulatory iron-sulfur-containing complex subunit RicT [Adlercreutzia aquisgranensis]|uniref:regulatory iron-sulfur-containing complex subunit RicT n=1 Tax=Adlercreutzia aquisgranensis TaxID=2941323 RepID=UPI00203B9F69|nr:regulatory iron-sulfur-containing complex subunit RicT [Adlercreutzia aquisgranensis]